MKKNSQVNSDITGFSAIQGLLVVLATLLCSACSGVPVRQSPSTTLPQKAVPKPLASALPKVENWEPAPQGGGYYLDDGPGDMRPTNLEALPSAEPFLEPIAIRNTRPYTVMGQTFEPHTSLEQPYRQKGRASWYGKKFHGSKTANGEIYDMHQMTAAHPTLPLPSYAKVTNLGNGKSVIVRVNDRGPFLRGRIIDLSYAAAYQLDYLKQGSAEVMVEKMTPESIALYHAEKKNTKVASKGLTVDRVSQISNSGGPVAINRNSLYLQIGAFGNKGNAETLLSQVSVNHAGFGRASHILSESGVYRVMVGPFINIDQANEAAIELSKLIQVQPVIKQDLIIP